MKIALHILRKDLRHLRVLLIVWLVLVALQVGLSAAGFTDTTHNLPLQVLFASLSWLVPVLQFLVLLVILPRLLQDEPLVGTTAFWFTRPIRPMELLKAKAIFVGAALVLAPALAETLMLMTHRVSATDLAYAIPEMLLSSLSFVLMVAALASLTGSFARFALVGVVAAVVTMLISAAVYFGQLFINPERIMHRASEMSMMASRQHVSTLVTVIFAAAVIVNQYTTRRTRRSIAIAIVYFVLNMVVEQAWPWDFMATPRTPFAPTVAVNIDAVAPSLEKDDLRVTDGESYAPWRPKAREIHTQLKSPKAGGYRFQPNRVRVEATFSNGVKREQDAPIQSYSFMNTPATEDVRDVLEGAIVMGTDRFSMPGAMDQNLLSLSEDDWNELKTVPATLSGAVTYIARRYAVAARLPLAVGESWRQGSSQVRIDKVDLEDDRVELTLRSVDVRLALKRGRSPMEAMRGIAGGKPVYVLINPGLGEAVLADNDHDFSFSMIQGQQRLAVKKNRLRFAQSLSDEWLAGAQLWRLEYEDLGTLEVPIEIADVRLADLRSQSRRTVSRSSREKVDPAVLAKIVLPPNPDTNAVRTYVRAILDASDNLSSYSSKDTQVGMLTEVGPEFLPVLAEFDNQYHLNQAIRRLAGPQHKDIILKRLADHTELVDVVVEQGWTEEARPTLVAGLRTSNGYLPTAWVRAVAGFKDPATYKELRAYFITGNNRDDTYAAIRDLPGIDLTDAIPQAWRAAKHGDSEWERDEMVPMALEAGILDALAVALDSDNEELLEKHDHKVLNALHRTTGQTGTVEEIRGWYQANKGSLTYNPTTARFEVRDQ